MLSKKIELRANDMAEAIELAKEKQLEIIIDKLSCSEYCEGRILYKNTRQGHHDLIKLMPEIHALEIAQMHKAMSLANPKRTLQLELLTSKKQSK